VSIEAAGGGIDRSGAAAEPADLLASAGARQRPLEVGEALTREIA